MGVTVVFGTSIATIFGVFIIPMLFIIIENLGSGKKHHAPKQPQTVGHLRDMD